MIKMIMTHIIILILLHLRIPVEAVNNNFVDEQFPTSCFLESNDLAGKVSFNYIIPATSFRIPEIPGRAKIYIY